MPAMMQLASATSVESATFISPVLAQRGGLEELILISIGLLILFGGWIANRIKEMQETRKRSEADLRGESAERTEQADLDALAARRREQLRRAAQQRSQGGGARGADGDADVGQLSMAERIARARAASQQGERETRQTAQPGWEDHQRETQRRTQQREQERRQREELHRRAAQREAQSEAELRRRAEAQRRARAQPQAPSDAASKSSRNRPPQRPKGRVKQGAMQRSGAHVSAYAIQEGRASVDMGTIRQLLRGPGLRDAIVLKEILDRPLGLRDADEQMWS